MMVKSAMMTTAKSVRTSAQRRRQGRVRPGRRAGPAEEVLRPRAVRHLDARDWRRFVQGQGYDLGMKPLAAKDLNGPSLAQGQVTSRTSFTREFLPA